MFNRRELLIGSIVTTIVAPSKTHASIVSQLEYASTISRLEKDGFVFFECNEPLSPDVRRALRWERAGVISVFSPDSARVVSVDRTEDRAYLWDAEAGTKLHTLQPIPSQPASVSFNSNGLHIVMTGYDGATRTWDATTGGAIFGTRRIGA